VKLLGLPPSSSGGVMLQKASGYEEEDWCGAHLNKRKNMKTSSKEELETVLIQ
jgi:hypothetical protein